MATERGIKALFRAVLPHGSDVRGAEAFERGMLCAARIARLTAERCEVRDHAGALLVEQAILREARGARANQ